MRLALGPTGDRTKDAVSDMPKDYQLPDADLKTLRSLLGNLQDSLKDRMTAGQAHLLRTVDVAEPDRQA